MTQTTAIEQVTKYTEQHEQVLRFEHFSNSDAWQLGKFLVDKVAEKNYQLAISIRRINGNIIFQHVFEGTNLNNETWMNRKFNTVARTEWSSLRAWAIFTTLNEPVPAHGLSESDYVFCGGGFPIRLKTGEVVGAVMVSGLYHTDDHDFIVEALSQYLEISEKLPLIADVDFSAL